MIIPQIAMTGGSRGGKSSILEHIKQELPKRGYEVIVAPESATMVLSSGLTWDAIKDKPKVNYLFQTKMMKLQLAIEDSFYSIAKTQRLATGKPTVLVTDRGCIDNLAFLPKEMHDNVFTGTEFTRSQVRRRYSTVIHLQTSAVNAEEYEASMSDNPYRHETKASEALEQDNKLLMLWNDGASPHYFIPAMDDFEAKKELVITAIIESVERKNV